VVDAGKAPGIVGISAFYHDAAAAAVRGGEIVAAAQEERFSRLRHDARFPTHALKFALDRLGGIEALDAVAYYEDPVLALDRNIKNAIDLAPETEALWPDVARSQLGRKLAIFDAIRGEIGADKEIFAVDHHVSHMASAFYPSAFEAAAILVVDGVGEWATTTIGQGEGARIEALKQIHYPHSLGLFYSAFTYHCGFKVNSGEYKLMGLAPYGRPRFVDLILENLIDLKPDGSFRLRLDNYGFMASRLATNEAFDAVMGCPRRAPEAPLTPLYLDIAASAQAVLEMAMISLAREALRIAGSASLCLAGGVALNCVANARLLRDTPGLKRLFVQPAAGDAGGALGAALHVAHAHYGCARPVAGAGRDAQKGSLLGPEFTSAEIGAALEEAKLVARRVDTARAFDTEVAQALADGLIVGRFEGAMEFGPRALGARSILADARRADGQTHINLRIKFRESWRPFAPAVLAERARDYFDLDEESPYMLLIANVREALREPVAPFAREGDDIDLMQVVNQRRSIIPAVTHVDYSARLQTVDAERFPRFHDLLARFEALTGSPVLVNTSFNQRGEPIVCTPHDAIACFLNTGIDLLAIGDWLVYKDEQPEWARRREGAVTYEPD